MRGRLWEWWVGQELPCTRTMRRRRTRRLQVTGPRTFDRAGMFSRTRLLCFCSAATTPSSTQMASCISVRPSWSISCIRRSPADEGLWGQRGLQWKKKALQRLRRGPCWRRGQPWRAARPTPPARGCLEKRPAGKDKHCPASGFCHWHPSPHPQGQGHQVGEAVPCCDPSWTLTAGSRKLLAGCWVDHMRISAHEPWPAAAWAALRGGHGHSRMRTEADLEGHGGPWRPSAAGPRAREIPSNKGLDAGKKISWNQIGTRLSEYKSWLPALELD